MANAKFVKLRWEKGSAYLKQGVKGNYIPYGALAGGNGTFIMAEPSKLTLSLKLEDGRYAEADIIKLAKNVNGWKKLSDKRVSKLKAKLKEEDFSIKDGKIENLGKLLKVEK